MRVAAAIVMASCLLSGVPASAGAPPPSFNIVTGFTTASNPNGVWTYLANGRPLAISQSACFNGALSGFHCWWTGLLAPNEIFVGRNLTKQAVSMWTVIDPPNDLWLSPNSGSATVRFTAPAAGRYEVAGAFVGIDTHEQSHPVRVLHGTATVFSGVLSLYTQVVSFDVTLPLSAGDHIDFTTSVGGTSSYLGTGLRGTIQAD